MKYHSEPVTRWLILGFGKAMNRFHTELYLELKETAKKSSPNKLRAAYFEIGAVLTGIGCIGSLVAINILEFIATKVQNISLSEIIVIVLTLFLDFLIAFFGLCAIKFRGKYNECLTLNNKTEEICFSKNDFLLCCLLGLVSIIIFFMRIVFIF